MRAGYPGTWRFRMTLLAPDKYAWTIYTSAQPDHYLFDGDSARTFVNGQEVAAVAASGAPMRSHARFMSLVLLDPQRIPGAEVTPLADADVPAGAARGLEAVFADDGARYRLGLDRSGRVVTATGPLDLTPFVGGEVTARFEDFRPVAGHELPHTVHYELQGAPLADETLLSACVDDPRVIAAVFQRPDLIPECMP